MSPVAIHRLIDLEADGWNNAVLLAGIAAVFRATSAKWPETPEAVRAFQHLWLDQYLEHERDLVSVALAPGSLRATPHVAGYLAGCRINPATSPRFATLPFFQSFAAQCATHPAHLHVNLDAAYRSQRIGERLVEALCVRLASEGIPGVHVVTARDQRNVGFYIRLGFRELACAPRGGSEVLFLGRRLGR